MAEFQTRPHQPEHDTIHSDINFDEIIQRDENDPTRNQDLWFVEPDSQYEVLITDETCIVRLSRISDDPFDHIGIVDTRDGSWWSWYRGQTANFDDILNSVGSYAEVIMTRYPKAEYVAGFLLRATVDLVQLPEVEM